MRKILWISVNCLLDTTSGASLAVLNMLKYLKKNGWDVECIGCTTFDNPNAIDEGVKYSLEKIMNGSVFEVMDQGNIKHTLLKTVFLTSSKVNSEEINTLFSIYFQKLMMRKPDIVFYYGGSVFDLLIPIEAKKNNIPSVIYVANSKYLSHSRWADDVSLVVTDTKATSELYKKRLNIDVKAVGSMIEKDFVVSDQSLRERVLFVNPEPSKGAYLVAQVAIYMSKYRPDIIFEVVESRGSWQVALNKVFDILKISPFDLDNVKITKNQADMRPVYGRARLLLQPSLAWESGSRVIAEAAMNGIPSMVTPVGGQKEMMGQGGIFLEFNEINYEAPYENLLSKVFLEKWVKNIEEWFDNELIYMEYSNKALESSCVSHDINKNIKNVIDLFDVS